MKTIKKHQKVEKVLEAYLKQINFDFEKLYYLSSADIVNHPELMGVGERTIRNCVNKFKDNWLPGELVSEKRTKSQKVVRYLEKKIDSGELEVSDLVTMRFSDLKAIPELKKVGRTTICSALKEMREKHGQTLMEDSIFQFIKKKDVKKPSRISRRSRSFDNRGNMQGTIESSDIVTLKKMINIYKNNNEGNFHSSYELEELKNALTHMGINSDQLLKAYRTSKSLS